jgi:hypothetical protein
MYRALSKPTPDHTPAQKERLAMPHDAPFPSPSCNLLATSLPAATAQATITSLTPGVPPEFPFPLKDACETAAEIEEASDEYTHGGAKSTEGLTDSTADLAQEQAQHPPPLPLAFPSAEPLFLALGSANGDGWQASPVLFRGHPSSGRAVLGNITQLPVAMGR